MQKLPVDLKGSGYLIFLSMLLALLVWMYFRNLLVFPLKTNFIPAFFLGFFFAMEFWCLFRSLDYTSVSRLVLFFIQCQFG